MFRAQQNSFDDAVAKATDENLTSENWEYILDVCDKANGEDSGPKDVVGAMIKRLAHRNANVQLYTLELANALSQNCGITVHRELCSRSFTDALLRLASERTTHQQVKTKILERMKEWTEMFSRSPELGIMEGAYAKLKTQNPNLHPPSKPVKRQITEADKRKEEEDLQMALELSLSGKDKQQPPAASTSQATPSGGATTTSTYQDAPSLQPASSGTTASTVSRVRALYDFQPSEAGELQFKKGDIIAVLESVFKDWWRGSLRGQTGIFPLNYVEKLSDPTQEELQKEAQMEAEVFAEIKNVEKLLTLLSTSNSDLNVRDNEEITTLYHSTLAIRPKLIELIGKYSQRKDDFTQLNEKFIKARRDYESLLEASMTQPPQTGYGAAYGRQGHQPYAYGGPAYSNQGPPPQQDPGRFYSPNPQDSRTPQPQYPVQNGPQPFHLTGQVPPAQHQQQQTPYPSGDPRVRTPSGTRPPPSTDPYHHRPQSTYEHPQELGTSSYSSPTENRRQSYPPSFPPHLQHSQQQDYSPSVYSPEDPDHQQQANVTQHPPPPQNAPTQLPTSLQQTHPSYNSTQPYSQLPTSYPPQPAHQPPKAPSPNPQNPYPVLNSGPPTAQSTVYQAYKPPQAPPGQPGYTPAPGSNPNDFYR